MSEKAKSNLFFFLKLTFGISILTFIICKYISVTVLIELSKQMSCNLLFAVLFIIVIIFQRFTTAVQTSNCFSLCKTNVGKLYIFNAQLVSSFYSLILPGDLMAGGITWYLITRHCKNPSITASVLFFIRLLNLIALVPFTIFGLVAEPRLIQFNLPIMIIAFIIICIIIIIPLFSKRIGGTGSSIISYFIIRLPIRNLQTKADEINISFWKSVTEIQNIPKVSILVLYSLALLIQLFGIISVFCCFKLVNIEIPYTVCFWLFPVMVIIHSLPFSICGIGVREISIVFIFTHFYNISAEASILFSSVIFIGGLLFGIWGGIISFFLKTK